MSAECLYSTVGTWCDDRDGDRLFYLSELPGINLKNAAQIADHETVKGETLMNKAISFASRMVVRDFLGRLMQKVVFREVIASEQVGYHSEDFNAAVAGLYGVEVTRTGQEDRYTRGYVEYIELKLESAPGADTDFLIVIDGGAAETKTVTLTAGINRIRIDKTFKQWCRVYADYSDLAVSDGSLSYGDSCDCPYVACDRCFTVDGIQDPTESGTFAQSNSLNGMVIAVACKADPDELVCQFREMLAPAVLYRAGAYMMEELLSSDRANPYVRNSRDEARENVRRWTGGVDPATGFRTAGEYEVSIQAAVEVALKAIHTCTSPAFESATMVVYDAVRPRVVGPRRNYRTKNIY